MNVIVLGAASEELQTLPIAERKAMDNALAKLEIFGRNLGYPHTSQVKGHQLRELRP